MIKVSYSALILAIVGLFLFSSCNEGANQGLTIEGSVGDAGNLSVAFEHVPIGEDPLALATTQADADGNFTINTDRELNPGIYRLRFGAQGGDLILTEKENNIQFRSNSLNDLAAFDYTVEGSEATAELINIFQMAKNQNFKSITEVANYVETIENPYVAIRFITRALPNRPEAIPVHESLSQNLTRVHPGTEDAQNYAELVSKMKEGQAQKTQQQGAIQVGMEAPEIEMEGPNGEIYRLSDLRGDVVLLDFWAAWCRPCRIANPKVVEIYNKYKDQGFKVFNVSLDGLDSRTKARLSGQDEIDQQMAIQKQRWVDAIEQDGLDWPWHVSQLKRWECDAAQTYGVRGIPRTYLIDRDGKIAAVNPRAQTDLESELLKLL
nr:redoxin domain-containing protein [Saprospiraceae bacterium]